MRGIVRIGLLVALGSAFHTVQADDFNAQVQLSYDRINPSESGLDDPTVLDLTGSYYFKPVSTDGVPVGEAAYINRASYVSLGYSTIDTDIGDIDVLAANVGVHIPNSIFFARLGVIRVEVPDFGGGSNEESQMNGTFGIVPIPRLFLGTDFTEDGYDPNLTVRYAGQFANQRWYAASVAIVEPDFGDTVVDLEFDYYFETFKLGGGFTTLDDRFEVRAEKGLPHGFALLGRFYTQDGGEGIGLTLTWRNL